MTCRAWRAACLLLASIAGSASALPPDVFPVNANRFDIPIKVVPERRAEIKALELYLSTDQGRTWNQVNATTPDHSAFPFSAQGDGEYWFTVVIVDQQNRREPPNVKSAAVNQKILIDTLKPEMKLKAERQGDLVNLSWEVREEHPDFSGMKIEWRSADASENWVGLPVTPGASGRTSIRAAESVVVRAVVKDAAGNEGKDEIKVAGSTTIVTTSGNGGMGTTTPEVIGAVPTVGPEVKTVPIPDKPVGVAYAPKDVKPPMGNDEIPLPPPLPPLPERKPETDRKPDVRGGADPIAVSPPPVVVTPPAPAPTPVPAPVPTPPPVSTPVKETTTPPPPAPASNELPVINNKRVTMEYEVTKYGPSGVGSVDLYMTRDDGMIWKKIAAEHQSMAAGTDTSTGVMRRTLSVDLIEDGIYGFHMVVKSGAGMSLEAPRSGTLPQMRLKLDTKLPEAALFKPEEDKTNPSALLIAWQATDENLASNPISIQWAEKPGGPWESIGQTQMANTGSFSWVVPANIPPKVYLRLTVRDTAGNVAVAETPTAVLVDLAKPVGHIKGLVGIRGSR